MIKAFVLLVFLAVFPGLAIAEIARIRSGEHPGYTRLVIELDVPAEWRLGRVEGGYGFEVLRDGVSFNTRNVFRAINRNRLSGIRYDQETGWLVLEIGCRCYIRAVDFNTSWIILDITDGAAPEAWPYEAVLEVEADSQAPESPRETETSAKWITAPTSGFGAKIPTPPEQTETVETVPEETRPDTSVPQVFEMTTWQTPWLNDALPDIPVETESTDPQPRPEPLSEQEERLLQELARAAAQGLLEADLPVLDQAIALPIAEEPLDKGEEPTLNPAPEEHVRLEAETSIDRDSGVVRTDTSVTPAGLRCLPDWYFAFEDWGTEDDPAEGLAERRMALVGEFDRPDPRKVILLAQYYLYLGFGAEAKATINAFGTDSEAADTIHLLATLIDGGQTGLPGLLGGQSACEGRVALWSVLAEGGPKPGQSLNTTAILSAFSALPIHLRRHVGPGLAERFLALEDEETALTIRNAITRAPGPHGAGLDLLNARLDMENDDPSASSQLESLLGKDDEIAPIAYAEFLRAELAAGRLPDGAAETAAALAFEIAETDVGVELAELAVRAVLASGNFDAARREALRLEEAESRFDSALWRAFAEGLVNGAQDGEFLRQSFAARESIAQAGLPENVAVIFAKRLNGLGFSEEAMNYLSDGFTSEAAYLTKAEVLLSLDRPAEAFGLLASIEGEKADQLRAQALVELGDPRGAAERFLAAGDEESAKYMALQAEAWDILQENGEGAIQRIAGLKSGIVLDEDQENISENTDPQKTSEGEPSGRVDRARATLASAQEARDILSELLETRIRE